MSVRGLILGFFKPAFDACWQRQLLDVVDTRMLADNKATQVLQRTDLGEA